MKIMLKKAWFVISVFFLSVELLLILSGEAEADNYFFAIFFAGSIFEEYAVNRRKK